MTKLWNLPVLRLIATDRCRVAAPWFAWANDFSDAAVLRRRANALERGKLGATNPIEQIVAACLYLAISLPRIVLALQRWGRDLRTSDHVSYYRQFIHLWICAWRLGLRPQVYYFLGLHRRRHPASWLHVIDPSELHHLQRDVSPVDLNPLEDKMLFTRHALLRGIPAVPVLAIWQDGRLLAAPNPGAFQRDLFVKRALAYGSEGVLGLRFDPATGNHRDDSRSYTPGNLDEKFSAGSYGATLLVQPWLKNHPDLAGFSTAALCNYRIVTGRHPSGRVEILLAALRFPLNSQLTCAEKNTTLCAAVDLITGRLHAAQSKRPGLGRLTRHPVTGQAIEDFAVPRWNEMVAHATAAHAHWPDFPFIGWDVSDTDEGLFFLEGSSLWGGFLAQMSGSRPLGLTPFASIYQANLAKRGTSIC
jgi:hypothetical protein